MNQHPRCVTTRFLHKKASVSRAYETNIWINLFLHVLYPAECPFTGDMDETQDFDSPSKAHKHTLIRPFFGVQPGALSRNTHESDSSPAPNRPLIPKLPLSGMSSPKLSTGD